MTTSQTQDFLSEFKNPDADIPPAKLAYMEARLAGLVHQFLLKLLRSMEARGNFSKRKLSHRINKKPEQITRWFASPGNLTIGTIAAIYAGAGYEISGFIATNLATGQSVTFQRPTVTTTIPAIWGAQKGSSDTSTSTGSYWANKVA
jgi:hypothetical protein